MPRIGGAACVAPGHPLDGGPNLRQRRTDVVAMVDQEPPTGLVGRLAEDGARAETVVRDLEFLVIGEFGECDATWLNA